MTWYYQDKKFTEDNVPDGAVGFVYLIETPDNLKYIGKKKFKRKVTRKPLKGKKRKRISYEPSNWEEYVGSSDATLALKEEHGLDYFKRTILHICYSLGELSYMEVFEQMQRNVLLRDDYLNGIIQCRINHKHLKEKNLLLEKLSSCCSNQQ